MAKAGYKNKIMRRDDYTCQYCGFRATTPEARKAMTIDHIISRFMGGTSDPNTNLVTACFPCNQAKSYYDVRGETCPMPMFHGPRYYIPINTSRSIEEWEAIRHTHTR